MIIIPRKSINQINQDIKLIKEDVPVINLKNISIINKSKNNQKKIKDNDKDKNKIYIKLNKNNNNNKNHEKINHEKDLCNKPV